jgi:hypothetical protein
MGTTFELMGHAQALGSLFSDEAARLRFRLCDPRKTPDPFDSFDFDSRNL